MSRKRPSLRIRSKGFVFWPQITTK